MPKWASFGPRWINIESSSFKPPHTDSKHAPNTYWIVESMACKATNSHPKLQSNQKDNSSVAQQDVEAGVRYCAQICVSLKLLAPRTNKCIVHSYITRFGVSCTHSQYLRCIPIFARGTPWIHNPNFKFGSIRPNCTTMIKRNLFLSRTNPVLLL